MKRNIMKVLLTSIIILSFGVITYGQDDGRIIRIPVVFHVLYTDGLPDNGINSDSREHGNSSEYLTREKIIAELTDLDKDFQLLNADTNIVIQDFKRVIGNAKVHFYLADILYIQVKSFGSVLGGTNTSRLHNVSPVINPDKCLNVYTGKIRYRMKLTNGLTPVKTSLGGDQTDDAINLNYQWVGLHYRLLTHETGHWLGLWHTFDPSQAAYGITDIPLQNEQTDTDCDLCPPNALDRLSDASRNNGFIHSNYNNFMDYSGCRVMFSVQQAAYIRHVIKDFRPVIWNSSSN